MKQIKNIRQSLGFCQEDMASTLGVTRSMIVRAENGSGNLNFEGCKQLINLDTYIKESEKTEDFAIAGNDEADRIEAFESQLRDCHYKAYPIRQKLKKLEAAYIKHQKSRKVLERMELHKDLFHPALIANLKLTIKEKLAKCSFMVRARLEMKIKGLEAEERYILEQIEKLKVKSEKVKMEVPETDAEDIKLKGESEMEMVETLEPRPMINHAKVYKIFKPAMIPDLLSINSIQRFQSPLTIAGSP